MQIGAERQAVMAAAAVVMVAAATGVVMVTRMGSNALVSPLLVGAVSVWVLVGEAFGLWVLASCWQQL